MRHGDGFNGPNSVRNAGAVFVFMCGDGNHFANCWFICGSGQLIDLCAINGASVNINWITKPFLFASKAARQQWRVMMMSCARLYFWNNHTERLIWKSANAAHSACPDNDDLCNKPDFVPREMFDCIDLWKFETRWPTDFFDKFPTDYENSFCVLSCFRVEFLIRIASYKSQARLPLAVFGLASTRLFNSCIFIWFWIQIECRIKWTFEFYLSNWFK